MISRTSAEPPGFADVFFYLIIWSWPDFLNMSIS